MLGATAQFAQLGASSSSYALQRQFAAGPLSSIGRRVLQTNLRDLGCTNSHRRHNSHHLSPLRAKSDDAAYAVRETLSGISSIEGRAAQTTNVVLGGDNSLQSWRELDEKVNEYPTERSFKAIGSGGDDFVASMISAVENAVGTVKPSRVQQRPSAKGKYVAVTIGPIMMQNADQVIRVYSGMREDERLRWYL